MGGFFRPGDIVLLDCRKRVDSPNNEPDREACIMVLPSWTITSFTMLELTCFVVSNSTGVVNKKVTKPGGNILRPRDIEIVIPPANWLTLIVLAQKRIREKRHQYEEESELVGKTIAIEIGEDAEKWYPSPISIIL